MASPAQRIRKHTMLYLERLTEPSDLVHADEAAPEQCEGHVDVVTALIADSQAAQPGHPGVCTFHDPAMASQTLAAVHALSGYAGLDAACPAFHPATAAVICLVGMQLAGPATWTAPLAGTHGRDRVQRVSQPHAIMTVGPTQSHTERCSAPIDDKVPFGAGLAAIRGVRPRFRPPFLAATLVLSSEARLQSS